MGLGRKWTKEEEEYLQEAWGNKSVPCIANYLKRSTDAIVVRANRLKLPPFLQCGDDYVTKHFLLEAIGRRGSNGYINTSYIQNRGLPTHRIKRRNQSFEVIYIDEFWEWAEKNQSFLDFSKFEKYALGPEPDWVARKRRSDFIRSQRYKKSPWTEQEDKLLRRYISAKCYTFRQLSDMLQRTEGAIQRRINDLGIKEKPIKANNHNKWSDEEWAMLTKMIKLGYNYEEMSDKLKKSAKAIRGRVFDVYLTERLDAVRSCIGKNGVWGDGAPDKPLKYRHLMKPPERETANGLLSELAGCIQMIAKSRSTVEEAFLDFWQKDTCMNWDDVTGCTAGETNCDSCTSFRRIPIQYCCRCGKDFLERKSNDFCNDCRIARKKSAQRKWAVLHNRTHT